MLQQELARVHQAPQDAVQALLGRVGGSYELQARVALGSRLNDARNNSSIRLPASGTSFTSFATRSAGSRIFKCVVEVHLRLTWPIHYPHRRIL